MGLADRDYMRSSGKCSSAAERKSRDSGLTWWQSLKFKLWCFFRKLFK